jgi:hypothetical protein
MKTNVGEIDTIIRVALGVALLAAGYYYETWLGLVGVLLMLTAALGFCPAYSLFEINTCPRAKE